MREIGGHGGRIARADRGGAGLALSFLAAALALGGCVVTPPLRPSVAVMPGEGKTFPAFQAEDRQCRQAATQDVIADAAAIGPAVNSSVVAGTVLGASEGALLGFAAGDPAGGAALGAAAGLFFGSSVGARTAGYGAASVQHYYDVTYLQCMATAGNAVPASAGGGGYAYPLYGYPYAPPYGPPYY
jgi:hypothetical protein